MKKFHCNKVRVADAGRKGLGVFAKGDLLEGEVVEFSPVIAMSREESAALRRMKFGNYAIDLGRNLTGIGLGYISLYNHSRKPNAEFESSPDGVRIVALRAIKAGEEVCFDYRWSDAELKDARIPLDA